MLSNLHRPLEGEPLALDLLNTAWLKQGRPLDWLSSAELIAAFASQHDVAATTAEASRMMTPLRRAREAILKLLQQVKDPNNVKRINQILQRGRLKLSMAGEGPTMVLQAEPGDWTLAVRAVYDATQLLAQRAERIRCCAHPNCTLWFLDTSRNGMRRWCSMASCGNRAKAKRHYQRTTAS